MIRHLLKRTKVPFSTTLTQVRDLGTKGLRNRIVTTKIKKNTTVLPRVDPEKIHRDAIAKTITGTTAVGRKTVADLKALRSAVPDFIKPPETFVRNIKNEITDLIQLEPYFFACKPRKDILHMVVVWQLACRRQGTHKTKYRTELAYTKKKMYSQKGTGRARHADRGAPQFRGGGHAHAIRPRDYSYKMNKKVQRLALRMALTAKYQQGKVIVVEDLHVNSLKTFESKAHLLTLIPTNVAKNGGVMIVDSPVDANFERGSWNLQWVDYWDVSQLNVYDMMRRNRLILTRSALNWLNENYKKYIELKV
jgi:large subunit ribosomal protein L4